MGILGTDGQMRMQGFNPNFRHPDGYTVKNTSRKEQNNTEFTYWSRLIKPWLAALVAPDGYSITVTKHFIRNRMHYWERWPSDEHWLRGYQGGTAHRG